jgi:hypothetical protein
VVNVFSGNLTGLCWVLSLVWRWTERTEGIHNRTKDYRASLKKLVSTWKTNVAVGIRFCWAGNVVGV